jgi:hypothetical protein
VGTDKKNSQALRLADGRMQRPPVPFDGYSSSDEENGAGRTPGPVAHRAAALLPCLFAAVPAFN